MTNTEESAPPDDIETHAVAPDAEKAHPDAARDAVKPNARPRSVKVIDGPPKDGLARLLPFESAGERPSFKARDSRPHRYGQIALIVASLACVAVTTLPSWWGKAGMAESQAPALDPGKPIADMTNEIKSLTANVNTMRGKLDTMRSQTESMGTSFAAMRANLDHSHSTDEIRALRKSVDALKQGFDQIKTNSAAVTGQASQALDRASRDQAVKLTQIAERLDKLEQDQTAKFAQVATRFDRIERRPAPNPDVTGSIPKQVPQPLPRPAIVPTPAPAPPKPAGLPGLALRDVRNGVALVQGPDGLFETGPGDYIPGAGQVEAIEKRGRDWVVVTSRGMIESPRR